MRETKNKRTAILAAVLIGLLILAYKVIFAPQSEDLAVAEDIAVSRVETMLKEIQEVNFDTSILEDEAFKSFISIETQFNPLPVGKKNPFAGF